MPYDYSRLDADWQRVFREEDPSPTASSVSQLVHQAEAAMRIYREDGVAQATLAPGTGYEYKLVLVDLHYQAAAAITAGVGADACDPDVIDNYRQQAAGAVRFGGELLVAIPDWRAVLVLNHGLHTPDYIAEKTTLGHEHTIPLAVFLTAFSEAVEAARR